jgi:hypothetical protein
MRSHFLFSGWRTVYCVLCLYSSRTVDIIPMKYATIAVIILTTCLQGCAHKTARPPIVFAPVNPDVASVKTIVTQTRSGNTRASESANRAVQIVEKIVVTPGQEQAFEKLKFELDTTVEQLNLNSDLLKSAETQIDVLTVQVEDMKQWGITQQELYHTEYGKAQTAESNLRKAEAKAVTADKTIWQRNRMIVIQWLLLIGLIAWIFKGPLLALARKAIVPILPL